MFVVFVLILMVACILVPFQVAAKSLGARRYSYMVCFLAVIASGIAGTLATDIISNYFLASIITLIFVGIFFSVLFDVGFKQGIAISLLAFAIQFCSLLILASIGGGVSALST